MVIQLVRKSDQSQLNISHEDALKLRTAAKGSNDAPLGSPKNGKPYLVLTLKLKARTFTWIQGDTHALWASHQTDEIGRKVFDALLERMKIGDSTSAEILKAEYVPQRPTAAKQLQKLEDLDLDF